MVDSDPSNVSYDALLCEVMIGGTPQYLICARLDGPVPLERMGGVTKEQIEALFRDVTLRATPLPRPGQPVQRTATLSNSMENIGLTGGG